MNKRRISAGIAVLTVVLLSIFLGGNYAVWLSVSLVLAASIGLVYDLLLPGDMRCSIDLPAYTVKKKKITAVIRLQAPGRKLPLFAGTVRVKLSSYFMGDEDPVILELTYVGDSVWQARLDIRPEYLGLIRLQADSARLPGLYGLFLKVIPLDQDQELMVLPETREPEISLEPGTSNLYGEEDIANRRGTDPTSWSGVRPYQQEDSLRQIHWKLTGKSDDYMVKELESPVRHMPVLFLETRMDQKKIWRIDELVEMYVSLSQHLVERGQPHFLCWRSDFKGEWILRRVENLSMLDETFSLLFRASFYEQDIPALAEIPEEYKNLCSEIIYLTDYWMGSAVLPDWCGTSVYRMEEDWEPQFGNSDEAYHFRDPDRLEDTSLTGIGPAFTLAFSMLSLLWLFCGQTGWTYTGLVLSLAAFGLAFLFVLMDSGRSEIHLGARKWLTVTVFFLLPLLAMALPWPRRGFGNGWNQMAVLLKDAGVRLGFPGILQESFGIGIIDLSEGAGRILCQIAAGLAVSMLLTGLGGKLRKRWPALLTFLLSVAFLIPVLRVGTQPGIAALVCLLLFYLLLIAPSTWGSAIGALPMLLIVCILSVGGLQMGSGRSAAGKWLDSLRYHQDAGVLPDGDLMKAVKMARDDSPDLKVRTGSRDGIYLRGFTGIIFEDNLWGADQEMIRMMETVGGLSLQNSYTGDWTAQSGGWVSVTDYLHEKADFYGLSQLAKGMRRYLSSDRKDPSIRKTSYSLSLQNVGGSRKYMYVPYEADPAWYTTETDCLVGTGETMRASGLLGRNRWSMTLLPSAAGRLSRLNGEDENAGIYSNYVDATCLLLDRKIQTLLQKTLEDGRRKNDTVTSIIGRVQTWLNRSVTYDENPGKLTAEKDFAEWFFRDNKKGYDVHYAAAAVLMFRYYGIPARYVEGYILPPGQGKGGVRNETITEEYAHAWPEVYIEEKGWIPVEVLPEYEEMMGQPYYKEEAALASQDPEKDPENTSDDKENAPDKEQETKPGDEDSGKEQDQQESRKEEQKKKSEDSREKEKTDQSTEPDRGSKKDKTEEKSQAQEEEMDLQSETAGEGRSALILLLMTLGIGLAFLLVFMLLRFVFHTAIFAWKGRSLYERGRYGELVVLHYDRLISTLDALELEVAGKNQKKWKECRDNRTCRTEQRLLALDGTLSKRKLAEMIRIRQKAVYAPRELTRAEAEKAVRYLNTVRRKMAGRIHFVRRIFRLHLR